MNRTLLWQVKGDRPERVQEAQVQFESKLESWIEADPDLLQMGLTIIARQLVVEAGRIDLLALDSVGMFVVVEIKRGLIYRDTLAQGLDYVECIASLSTERLVAACDGYLVGRQKTLRGLLEERDALSQLDVGEREVLLHVVGTGKAERLDRLAEFLRNSISITVVVFDVYRLADGQELLLRELSESDARVPSAPGSQQASIEGLCRQADANGIGTEFRRLAAAGLKAGLHHRLWKTSIMFAPQTFRSRMIFTVWVTPRRGKVRVYRSPKTVAEFYPTSATQVMEAFGGEGYAELEPAAVASLADGLEQLFASIQNGPTPQPGP